MAAGVDTTVVEETGITIAEAIEAAALADEAGVVLGEVAEIIWVVEEVVDKGPVLETCLESLPFTTSANSMPHLEIVHMVPSASK